MASTQFFPPYSSCRCNPSLYSPTMLHIIGLWKHEHVGQGHHTNARCSTIKDKIPGDVLGKWMIECNRMF